ncbi:hypothetical protein [Spirosoma endophyticum]|uniref:Uncharacterized protein n=1 Tax=Spirosoma endophyticum TaxID=662367 RepID=A0A1I2GJC5_9BACT|nr:hypothetical protein [Spirosoma endophyticum]SFF17685.1 hypothetical protein SAMN05216167_13323 [Spirosoma endophyticum]
MKPFEHTRLYAALRQGYTRLRAWLGYPADPRADPSMRLTALLLVLTTLPALALYGYLHTRTYSLWPSLYSISLYGYLAGWFGVAM